MKTKIKQSAMLLIMIMVTMTSMAQKSRQSITVLNIDSKGIQLDPAQLGNLARIELEKLDSFDVTDRYDVAYLIDKNKLNITSCYGKTCLLEVGGTIKSDYMFTGSVELYGQTIVATFRLINVSNGRIERTAVDEYLNLPLETQQMMGISIRKMFGRRNDEELVLRLTKKFDYENSINNPDRARLNLQGPRFGYVFVFGEMAGRLASGKSEGGYDAYPAMFQCGYQFEKQYLNEGHYQALFEFIPLITGVDQQMLIPSFTFLNGFRNNQKGWEIAIGPSVGLASYSKLAKYQGKYYTGSELESMGVKDYSLERHLDSRGNLAFSSALVMAFGKTLKSGKMNIPLNLYVTIPTMEGFRIGLSVGYNSKK